MSEEATPLPSDAAGPSDEPDAVGGQNTPSRKKNARRRCVCGKLDRSLFMVQCDGCDWWLHGKCAGVSQEQALALDGWKCKACVASEKRAKLATRLYCVCRRPWDGQEFMIACDSCHEWFHAGCVGLELRTAQEFTSAAFHVRRYHIIRSPTPPP